MRSLALTLAVFWSLQVLVCLVPAEPAHATSADDHHASGHAAHAGHSEAPRADGHGSHHSSQSPSSDHHNGSDAQCEQHCASLKQTLTLAAAAVPAPSLLAAAAPAYVVLATPRARAGAIARLELERPPPDILALHSTLRI